MKIRTGFVSNSSSSSFVMVGIKIADQMTDDLMKQILNGFGYDWKIEVEKQIKRYSDGEYTYTESDLLRDIFYDYIYDSDFCVRDGSDNGVGNNEVVLGKRLAETQDYSYFENQTLSVYEVMEIGKELNDILNTNKQPKVYIGTRLC